MKRKFIKYGFLQLLSIPFLFLLFNLWLFPFTQQEWCSNHEVEWLMRSLFLWIAKAFAPIATFYFAGNVIKNDSGPALALVWWHTIQIGFYMVGMLLTGGLMISSYIPFAVLVYFFFPSLLTTFVAVFLYAPKFNLLERMRSLSTIKRCVSEVALRTLLPVFLLIFYQHLLDMLQFLMLEDFLCKDLPFGFALSLIFTIYGYQLSKTSSRFSFKQMIQFIVVIFGVLLSLSLLVSVDYFQAVAFSHGHMKGLLPIMFHLSLLMMIATIIFFFLGAGIGMIAKKRKHHKESFEMKG